jgi:hypothetical protein
MSTPTGRVVPCVLMRAGTSRGPFFLREWLPADERARNEALIGAIGASDLLQLDGVGGGSTLTSKVAIVSRSHRPGCDGKVLNAFTLDILDGRIQTIRSVINPDKLGHLGPVADAWAVAREANQARRPTD